MRMNPPLARAAALAVLLGGPAAMAATTSAEAEKYTVAASVPDGLTVGGQGTYTVTITPKEGYELKVETPFKAQLSSNTGVKIARAQFGNQDFDDPKTAHKSISTPVTPTKAGDNHLAAELTFFICDPQLCERFQAKPELTFSVAK